MHRLKALAAALDDGSSKQLASTFLNSEMSCCCWIGATAGNRSIAPTKASARTSSSSSLRQVTLK
jgi:hypothetical protein